MVPRIAPITAELPPARVRQAPVNPPITMRAISGPGAVLAGVLGNRSATNSPRAPRVTKPTTHGELMKASEVPASFSQPRRAPQATTAGAVKIGRAHV